MEIQVIASGSSGNCYRIRDGTTSLLLECGIQIKRIQQALNFHLTDVDACLISHEHGDHSKAASDVLKAGIDIYTSAGTASALGLTGHHMKLVREKEPFSIGTFTILPFDTEHDAAEPLGFLIADQSGEKLLFATDTYYIKYKFQRLTHIMLECNYSVDILNENIESGLVPGVLKNRLLKSHFSLEHVKEFLTANDLSDVKGIWLIHLSNNNSNAEQFKREIMETTGKTVYIA
ncbi:MBL fold metallo-hydrolase [Sporolactobacillus terrae]|uniref:MBL fold metallo-hydrolase n=1 Tax=Sporolactobacillus terrae TaxID=269673 RepID=UPI001CC0030E|nr:MBL fold metallo-hydrolase [Sporolactobacillus terrae]UAK17586.1 MBL fold metallo-hydrolase [Sporolactobacillus terrae]